VLHRPRGAIAPRVRKVGPEHFGVGGVDCAKARSKWMFVDFYGNTLVPPTVVEHTRDGLGLAVRRLGRAVVEHDIRDLIVSVERTGTCHQPVFDAFRDAGFDTRIIHPFTVKQFRLPAHPGQKSDDTDLLANCRAAINGFALAEPYTDDFWRTFKLLVRHRRDLVCKSSLLSCQIKEHLQIAMPGYTAEFPTFWDNAVALELALQFGSARALLAAGLDGLADAMTRRKVRFARRSLQRALAWAAGAASPGPVADEHLRIAADLAEDRAAKRRGILDLERRIAGCLARTPYILLLAAPGLNVVSVGEFAGEAGPIANYPSARNITGRAGLYPSRYQSDEVDRADGPLVKCGNRRLRFAILQAADCLVQTNHHFAALAGRWRSDGADPRLIRVRAGNRFARIAFQVVAGGKPFRHPSMRETHYVLEKLLQFHMDHRAGPEQIQTDLQAAGRSLTPTQRSHEAVPLQRRLDKMSRRRRGAGPLGKVLGLVLAELATRTIHCEPSGM
jgi:transposase